MAVITAELREGTAVTLQARQFSWTGDEPVGAGGTDTGPDPYELLLGGLAACIAVTLRLYADHKGIALGGVDVRLEFDRVHADDCIDCDERQDGVIERIRSEVDDLRIIRRSSAGAADAGGPALPCAQDAGPRRDDPRRGGLRVRVALVVDR